MIEYLDLSRVTASKVTSEPRHRRRQDGYGSLIPSALMLQIDGRWHRVRTTCWSNAGTDFVCVAGKQLALPTGWYMDPRRPVTCGTRLGVAEPWKGINA